MSSPPKVECSSLGTWWEKSSQFLKTVNVSISILSKLLAFFRIFGLSQFQRISKRRKQIREIQIQTSYTNEKRPLKALLKKIMTLNI